MLRKKRSELNSLLRRGGWYLDVTGTGCRLNAYKTVVKHNWKKSGKKKGPIVTNSSTQASPERASARW